MDSSPPQDFGFADMIAPVERAQFFGESHRKTPLHIPGAPDKFHFAMTWEILTGLLNQSAIWSPQSLELYLDANKIPDHEYCLPGITREGAEGMLVDLARLRGWVGQGASILLNDIETLTPGMAAIAKALGDQPGGKVQGNLYCSWQAHQAFPVHFDTHDVFAMQIAGEKRWRIYQRHFKDPINHPEFKQLNQDFHEQHKGAIGMEVVMKPGDLIYIPRGYYHDAIAESDATVHLSYSVVPVIGLDLISAVFERAVHDEVFRQAIPEGEDAKATEQHLTRLAGRFRELVRDPDFQAKFLENMRSYRFERAHIKLPDDAKKT